MLLPKHPGIRQYRRAKTTGTYVGVYDGLESGFDPGGDRWQTVCWGTAERPHALFVSYRTLQAAMRAAPYPERWCEACHAAGETLT